MHYLLIFAYFLGLNLFLSRSSPNCELPSYTGPCKSFFSRYFYNKDSQKCEVFVYGGCNANSNNFRSLEECEEECSQEKNRVLINENKLASNFYCNFAPEAGPCRYYFVRYYYDFQTGFCENFVYGGCGGNENNFLDLGSCLRNCP